ncbi:MAG: hypothetical protein KAR05_09790 [Candidatus Omnitrophica bacterium]|nr:hypothetical protein [Candidatus Omnitrophota bacterium]
MKNKSLFYPGFLLAASLVIFSVIVPLTQGKIDYWKEQRQIYSRNLLNVEFQRVIRARAVDLYEAIHIIKGKEGDSPQKGTASR